MAVVVGENDIKGLTAIFSAGNKCIDISAVNRIVNMPYRPAFYAYGTASGTNTVGSDIIFPSTTVNNGNHYDTLSGRFTAPINGIYQFNWSSIAGDTSGIYRFYLKINGALMDETHLRLDTSDSGGEYADNAAYCVTWELSAGDYVQIFYEEGAEPFFVDSSPETVSYNYFQGWLIG